MESSTGVPVTCGSPLVDPDDRLALLDSPMRGNPDGFVTIVVWTGFADPFSRQLQDTLQTLLQGPSGPEIRIVSKQMPLRFQDPSGTMARAGLAAHVLGEYWAFHDAMFALEETPDADDIDGVALSVGFDLDVFHETMDSDQVTAQLEADQALFAAVGGMGTPSWVANGAFHSGAQPIATFESVALEQLEAMNELVDGGLSPCAAFEQRLDAQLL